MDSHRAQSLASTSQPPLPMPEQLLSSRFPRVPTHGPSRRSPLLPEDPLINSVPQHPPLNQPPITAQYHTPDNENYQPCQRQSTAPVRPEHPVPPTRNENQQINPPLHSSAWHRNQSAPASTPSGGASGDPEDPRLDVLMDMVVRLTQAVSLIQKGDKGRTPGRKGPVVFRQPPIRDRNDFRTVLLVRRLTLPPFPTNIMNTGSRP